MNLLKNLRDKTRDELNDHLNSIGVDSQLVERGQSAEKEENSWYQRSLGVIEIREGPIVVINILKKDRTKHSPPKWWIILGIPDERLTSNHLGVKIKTVRKKSFPIFGKVVDIAWKGNDSGTGLLKILSTDADTKMLSTSIGNLEVKSKIGGWTLTVDRRMTPTRNQWESFEKITNYILKLVL